MRLAQPYFLLLLLVIPASLWYFRILDKKGRKTNIQYPSLDGIKKTKTRIRITPDYVLRSLRILCLVFLIIALARPQAGQKGEEVLTKGIDIMLVMDTSTSMQAEDFKPNNRFYVAKQAVKDFIKGRKNDRIGVIVFSGVSFVQCPLTLDYGAVLDFVDSAQIGMTQTDGTAIGTAIINGVNHLKETGAKSKVMILFTDGRNNMGEIDPLTAAKVADAMGIKIYSIGVGKHGAAPFPVEDPIFGRRYVWLKEDLDEGTLTKIAQATSGLYFRATDAKSLGNIFTQIDKMEKTEIKVKEYTNYTELFGCFLWPGLIFLFLEILLANTYFIKIP